MNRKTFQYALREARRFLEVAAILEQRITYLNEEWPISGTRETGAVRRASMDLTRALSALRGNGYDPPALAGTVAPSRQPDPKQVGTVRAYSTDNAQRQEQ